jgi:aminoglycoside phosphotransferase (APT) family kinase protein
MEQLMAWLPAHMPASARDESKVSIVHGDFRMDNLMFHPTEPRVLAVLDWELSTLGHPLADFSYHCMAWHIAPGQFRGIGGLDLQSLGIPSEADYIRMYCERTGITTPQALKPDWNFYLAYNHCQAGRERHGLQRPGGQISGGCAASGQDGLAASAASRMKSPELASGLQQHHAGDSPSHPTRGEFRPPRSSA